MLTACGDLELSRAGSTATPASTPVSEQEFRNAAEIAADDAVLVLKDLSGTWRSEPNSSANYSILLEKMPAECRQLFMPGPSVIARKDSNKFTGELLIELTSNATVYRTAQIARTEEKSAVDGLSGCGEALADVFRENVQTGLARHDLPVDQVAVRFEKVDAPHAGESSNEFRITFDYGHGAPPGHFAIIEVHQGRIIGTVMYTAASAKDTARTHDAIVAILARRLARADARLPQ